MTANINLERVHLPEGYKIECLNRNEQTGKFWGRVSFTYRAGDKVRHRFIKHASVDDYDDPRAAVEKMVSEAQAHYDRRKREGKI